MTYQETTQYLFTSAPLFQNVGKDAYKEGLYNTEMLDEHFDHPHTHFKTVHIAGTNGKGSCSHTIASVLQCAGYKVGLFTSPHLIDFRERIRVNGEPISEQYVIDFVEEHRSFFEPLHPSFFELTTAMAFKYFAELQVDIAVIEVGLGGRLDCTNIITPLVSVITNISFDHVMFLGDTLAKIAGEKAGIIKSGVPAVIGEYVDETRPVFENKALDVNAPITFAEDCKEVLSYNFCVEGGLDYETKAVGKLHSELGGACQVKNTNTILCALSLLNKALGGTISDADIKEGFASVCERTGLMGRWQKVGTEPATVCDTGHNVGGFQYIVQQLAMVKDKLDEKNADRLGDKIAKLRMVIGMVNDKDINGVLAMLPTDAVYYFTQASVKRALPCDEIKAIAAKHNLIGEAYPTIGEAYAKALADSACEDFIYIGGSSFVVADFLTLLKSENV